MTENMEKNIGKRTEKNTKKKMKLRSNSRLIIFIAVIVLILGSGVLLAHGILNISRGNAEIDDPDSEKVVIKGRKNVLLIGVDAREGEGMARADTIMLASLDTDLKKAVIVSVPRDTRVKIPRHGMDKINSATVYGGPEMLVETVSDLFNIRMDGYVLCDYDGFIEIIDALGGVTMDIEEGMYHYDPDDNGKYTINLPAGKQQHLDGSKALQFVRYRTYALADITRTQQQQQFLQALAGEIIQTNIIIKLPKLVPTILRNVQTDLGYSDVMALAKAAKQFKDFEIASQTLPGYFLDMDGLSYWETNQKEASTLIARLYEGEDINEVVWGSKVVRTDIASSGEKPVSGVMPESSELEDDPDIEITPVNPGDTGNTGSVQEPNDWWNDENIDEWWNGGDTGNSGGTGGSAGSVNSDTGGGTTGTGGADAAVSPEQDPAVPPMTVNPPVSPPTTPPEQGSRNDNGAGGNGGGAESTGMGAGPTEGEPGDIQIIKIL